MLLFIKFQDLVATFMANVNQIISFLKLSVEIGYTLMDLQLHFLHRIVYHSDHKFDSKNWKPFWERQF